MQIRNGLDRISHRAHRDVSVLLCVLVCLKVKGIAAFSCGPCLVVSGFSVDTIKDLKAEPPNTLRTRNDTKTRSS